MITLAILGFERQVGEDIPKNYPLPNQPNAKLVDQAAATSPRQNALSTIITIKEKNDDDKRLFVLQLLF
jgi:hypothetical protein